MMERLSALVLDSDPASLSTISETLAKVNFTVFPFQTAEAAMDFIKCGSAKEAELDLVLVDTSANSVLLHHILNELHVPLVAMCSRDDEETLSKCTNLGARFHVLKPLDRRSFSILWHQALEHKSKKAAPQGPTLNSTKNRMVPSSTEKPKELLILERNDLSNPKSNGYEEPKKRNRFTWTTDLHEKFLDAVEALGGDECATPDGILHLMNMKGLTAKHVGSHLQKHRLRQRNAKQGGKPFPELIISTHDEATSESITPRVETDREAYPSRMWSNVKKRSVDTAALETDIYTYGQSTYGNYREDTESACVWDKYDNIVQGVFSEKKKCWQFMSRHQRPGKNNIVITDEGGPNEAPESAGGASIEISSSSMENINLLKVYGASIEKAGSSSLLTSDQVGQNNLTEAARNNDTMGNINFLEGTVDPEYNASMDFSVAWAHLKSNDLDLTGPSEGQEEADSFWMSHLERSQEHQSLGLEDNACNYAQRSVGLINVDEPVTQESQEQQNLAMEDLLQLDDIAWDDALRSAGMVNLLNEPIAQEAAIRDAMMDDPVSPFAQDDVLWSWSPAGNN